LINSGNWSPEPPGPSLDHKAGAGIAPATARNNDRMDALSTRDRRDWLGVASVVS
jgi:hypothetical protein